MKIDNQHIIGLVSFIVLVIFSAGFAVFSIRSTNPETGSPRDIASASLSRGPREIVIVALQAQPKMMMTLNPIETTTSGFYVYITGIPLGSGADTLPRKPDVLLDSNQWIPIDTLRWQWCETKSSGYQPLPEQADYLIGVRCGSRYDTRIFAIENSELPTELQTIVAQFTP